MYLNKNSFYIDNVNMGTYLISVKYGYHKIWDKDAGRNNIAGTYTGTLIGIFPKFTLHFGTLTQAQLETIVPLLDKAQQNVSYYDPNLKRQNTISCYSGDYEIENKNTLENVNTNEEFEISIIARAKR